MTQLTTTKPLRINYDFQGTAFVFREDGYFHMTTAAKAFGKQLQHFWNSPETAEYLLALGEAQHKTSKSDELPPLFTATRGKHGGTWAHPKLAVIFARWLSPRFAVWCDAVIEDLLAGRAQLTITKPDESAILALQQRNDEQATEIGLVLTELADALAKVDEVKREAALLELKLNAPLTIKAFQESLNETWGDSFIGKLRTRATRYGEITGQSIEKRTRPIIRQGRTILQAANWYPRKLLELALADLAELDRTR